MGSKGSIALIVAEAVFYAYYYPTTQVRIRHDCRNLHKTYQRLVKTTPNPRATKKSNGELEPEPVFPVPDARGGVELEGVGPADEVSLAMTTRNVNLHGGLLFWQDLLQ